MTPWDIKQRPNRLPWPPVLLLGTIGLGFLLRALFPFGFESTPISQTIGALFIACALALDVWASLTFRRAQTTIMPHQGTKSLVTGGPFQYSRNPIYVGNLLILVGVGLLAGSLWHVVLVVPLAFAIQSLAIVREEAHLAANFGKEWQYYTQQVRRWV